MPVDLRYIDNDFNKVNECGSTLRYCTDHSYRWETQNMFLQYLLYSHIATVGLYSYSSCRIKGTPIAWMTWHLQYIFWYFSWHLPFNSIPFFTYHLCIYPKIVCNSDICGLQSSKRRCNKGHKRTAIIWEIQT